MFGGRSTKPLHIAGPEHLRMARLTPASSRTAACVLVCLFESLATITAFADGDARKGDGNLPLKVTTRADVVYGRVQGAGLLADIAFPESKEPVPVIISVHGGRWVSGHKRDASTIKVEQWAGFGFFAMSIDYRLKGCTPAPACYQDLQCAIRYVHAHAQEFQIDTRRIFLIGQSAGGHLVSLAATAGDDAYPRTGGWEKASNDFRAAISLAAAYDLTTLDWGDLWTPPGVAPDAARAQASPTRHVTRESKPLLILHSDNDRSVPIANALAMIDALQKAGAPYVFRRYPKMGHMGINQEVIDQSLAFIKEISAKPAGKE
jgi:alpha-L-fucosidase 2